MLNNLKWLQQFAAASLPSVKEIGEECFTQYASKCPGGLFEPGDEPAHVLGAHPIAALARQELAKMSKTAEKYKEIKYMKNPSDLKDQHLIVSPLAHGFEYVQQAINLIKSTCENNPGKEINIVNSPFDELTF